MRSNCLIFVAIIVGFSLLPQTGCQEETKAPAESKAALASPQPEPAIEPAKAEIKDEAGKAGPKITFEKIVHDFGEVAPGAKKTCEFKFKNAGNSLLKITKVERCCGVTTKLDKMQYGPGDSGTITVEYNASTGAGLVDRQLYVVSNDRTNPKAALTIKANIVPKISFEPNDRMGLVIKDQSCPEITITSLDGKMFAIKEIKSTGNCITFDYDPNKEAAKFVLQPQVDKEKIQANPHGLINIALTHPDSHGINIPFNRLSRFQVSPPQIIAFNAVQGQPITRKIVVQNNYDEDFEIESTSSQNKTIKVLSQNKIKNGYQLTLEIMPPPDEGKSGFTDEFLLNIKGAEKMSVSFRGFYLKRK
ncbi:MAG: hypothetical protein A2167_05870 [Planctomycetes bacterium RBG_13_46_10]|nr:MAG: hypothetical protein A2167_05870 [Planctomycetes bacterium RBG_13_46_10]